MEKLRFAALVTALPALGAFGPIPALASAPLGAALNPNAVQLADNLQSTGSSSTSSSASSSSSATVSGGKQRKCTAEATANAKADGVEDSDHDLKVAEGDGCSAKAESRAVVKPKQEQQSD